jgi:hypothetical protein
MADDKIKAALPARAKFIFIRYMLLPLQPFLSPVKHNLFTGEQVHAHPLFPLQAADAAAKLPAVHRQRRHLIQQIINPFPVNQ